MDNFRNAEQSSEGHDDALYIYSTCIQPDETIGATKAQDRQHGINRYEKSNT
jgi:hypothetical protein